MFLLVCAGLTEGYFGYRQARAQMAKQQEIQARSAAIEIEQYLESITRGLRQIQSLPWGQSRFGPERRRDELHRLMALNPAMVDVQDADTGGRELLFVSRALPDRLSSGARIAAATAQEVGYGSPFFDEQGVPNVRFSLPLPWVDGSPAVTSATINLRFLADVVSGLRSKDEGTIYVVDADDRLIAHPDPTLVLRQLSVHDHASVAAARRTFLLGHDWLEAISGPGIRGGSAITTGVLLRSPQWLLFVEQPRAQAMQPALATLQRMVLLIAVGGTVALMLSRVWAMRMAAPISRLREATAKLASGELGTQLKIHTDDEIQLLANDFNMMSARLQQSYSELENKVVARTAEIASRRDEAERANAAKTRFLATASHDLREPMHAIGLLVGLLRERVQQADLRTVADKTYHAVQTMEGLFSGLLDISKLDAGEVTPTPELFALENVLMRVSHAYAPLAVAKGLVFRVHSAEAWVRTDPVILERIVGNLCVNAIRYTHRGGVLVACRRRKDRIALQIIDTGIGIHPDHQQLIFEEFVRLNAGAGSHDDKGLGLGLSIVRRSAELLGLDVRVCSKPGIGSRFEVLLPAHAANPTGGDDAAPVAGSPSVAGLFVLVVDDEEASREAMAALLMQWGCLVATAASAELARQELAQHLRPPDVIVTDLRLGVGANGIDLIHHLRAQLDEVVPAILVTADTGIAQGADVRLLQVIHKPAGPERVHAALCCAIGVVSPVRPVKLAGC